MAELAFRAAGPSDIAALGALSRRIWLAAYADLLPPAQIEYMLAWMYGPDAIASEMARGIIWQVVELAGEPVGYLSLAIEGPTADLQKLYLAPELQGRGLGQAMLAHVGALARRGGATEVRLRVNRKNARALRSYVRAGFRKVGTLVSDIGGGFVMDDEVLARNVEPSASPVVKICGLSTPDTMEAALASGADQVGLVFFPRSPRHVRLDQARALAAQARGRAEIVALTVDAEDALVDAIMAEVGPDWLQLHGAESADRVASLRSRTGRRIMKALGIGTAADLEAAGAHQGIADRILFDARPPQHAALPGGNGQPFDWTVLRDAVPGFMLSGGLTSANVVEALRISRATAVDVSSGVESAPGRKDVGKIADFVRAAKATGHGRDLASPAR